MLRALSAEVKRFDELVAASRKNLQALGRGAGVKPLLGLLGSVRAEMATIATASAAMATATNRNFATMNARMATSTANANALAAAMARVGAASTVARTSGVPIIPRAGGGGHGGGQGGGSGLHLSSLGVGVPMAVGHAHARIGGPGTGGLIAAGVGAWGLGEIMKAGMEPMHQEAMLKLLGLSPEQISEAKAAAWATVKAVPGTTFAEGLKMIGEQYSIVGLPGALKLNAPMAMMDQVLARTGKGKEEGSAYVMTRATELMGKLTDPVTHQVDIPAFQRILDVMVRGVIATHGKVTPEQWLNAAQQAGPAFGSLSDEGMFTEVAIMQAMKGHRAGTAAAALQRQFAGGIMSQRTAHELTQLGIAQAGDFEVGRGGQVRAKTDAMKGMVDRLQKDPLGAIIDVVIPALERKGFTTPEAISREIYRFVGTGPAQREVYELIRGREQIQQERARMKGGMGTADAMATIAGEDPDQVTKAFTASFKTLLGAIGGPMMLAAIPAMNALAATFNTLANAAGKHPVAGSVAGYAGAGAIAGAGIGWLFGGVGAVPGALIGGAVGGAYGLMTSPWSAAAAGAPLPTAAGMTKGDPSSAYWGDAKPRVHVDVGGITIKAETDRPDQLASVILDAINMQISRGFLYNQGEAGGALNAPAISGAGP